MAGKTLENFTTEQLLKSKKSLKKIMYIAFGLMLIYGCFMFYKMYQGIWESKSLIIIVPFIILIAVYIPKKSLDGIKAELARRNQT